ncbi:MAG TPA: aldehyde dehydrogenase family protein [Ilumatobacteraceae bacterium]
MTPHMTIGGERAAARAHFAVINPATEENLDDAPACQRDQLDAAFEAALKAFPAWSNDEDTRLAMLSELADRIVAAGPELVDLLVLETGKPRDLAEIEISACKTWIDYAIATELPRTFLARDAHANIEMRHRPLGVVAAILPWNFPIVMTITKLAPALRVGNTMVIKPSPFTPFSSLRLGEIVNEVVPAGVVNFVSGGDEVGQWMTAHPTPRKVTFTGSIASGKHVAVAAGADLKRVTLELGGNDAAILMDDIDVGPTADAVLARAFFNAGQACALPKRVFAPAGLYDEVVDAFTAAAERVQLGASDGPLAMGPLSTRPQFRRICELVTDADAHGVKATTGGGRADRPGFFFQPTILTGASAGVRIVDEEQFGPALPIIPYSNVDDATRMANDTMFGLCGSVWGQDLERATKVAERLECGVSYVNSHGVHRPSVPLMGSKWSGIGMEHGLEGMLEFTDPHVVFVAPRLTDTALT